MLARLLRLIGLVRASELVRVDATWRIVVVDLLRENEELKEVAERYHEENAALLVETSDLYE